MSEVEKRMGAVEQRFEVEDDGGEEERAGEDEADEGGYVSAHARRRTMVPP
jgi:hypothetical protein